jgi:hypothetical protein
MSWAPFPLEVTQFIRCQTRHSECDTSTVFSKYDSKKDGRSEDLKN